MRTSLVLSIGWIVGVIAGVCLTTASIAKDPRSTEAASELANDGAEPVAESVAQQIEKFANQIQGHTRSGFEVVIRSQGLRAKRPRVKADEDSAARAERQKNLVQWISDIDAMRSELLDHEARLDAVSDQIRVIGKLNMTDEEVTELVNLEQGIHQVVRMLQRGIRELDLARRRGTNALDDRLGD